MTPYPRERPARWPRRSHRDCAPGLVARAAEDRRGKEVLVEVMAPRERITTDQGRILTIEIERGEDGAPIAGSTRTCTQAHAVQPVRARDQSPSAGQQPGSARAARDRPCTAFRATQGLRPQTWKKRWETTSRAGSSRSRHSSSSSSSSSFATIRPDVSSRLRRLRTKSQKIVRRLCPCG